MIFFTGNNSFSHQSALRQRPFDDVDAMNGAMNDGWNNVVADDDHVYVLGNFAFGNPDQVLGVLEDLAGTKILISGPIDRPYINVDTHNSEITAKEQRRYDLAKQRYLNAGFSEVYSGELNLNYEAYRFKLSHFSYDVSDNHALMAPFDDGRILLSGSGQALSRGPNGGLNIGVNVEHRNYAPVSVTEVIEITELYGV